HLLRRGDTPKRRVRGRSYQFAGARLDIRGRGVVNGNRAEAISLAEVQRADLRFADAHCIREHGLEHRPQLARRAADDLQYFRRRSLPLQRFAQLVEQAGILDGDDGLLCEIADKFNLLLRKWSYLLAVNADGTNQLVLLEHWNDHDRAGTAQVG